jgi:hypothetical protein
MRYFTKITDRSGDHRFMKYRGVKRRGVKHPGAKHRGVKHRGVKRRGVKRDNANHRDSRCHDFAVQVPRAAKLGMLPHFG